MRVSKDMKHHRFERPGFLAIAPNAIGGTFAAVPRGGIPNQMIKPPATAPTPARASGRSDDRDPPWHQDSHKNDGKGMDKYRRNGTRPGDRQPEMGPPPPVPTYDPYPDGKGKTGGKARAAGPSLSALRAENARLRAERAQLRKASKAPPAPSGPKLLTGREREEMDRGMGIISSRVQGPGVDELGRFVVGVEKPTQTRARLARAGRKV